MFRGILESGGEIEHITGASVTYLPADKSRKKNEDNPSLSYFYEMLMMSEKGGMERAMFHRKAGGLVVAPVYAREGIC